MLDQTPQQPVGVEPKAAEVAAKPAEVPADVGLEQQSVSKALSESMKWQTLALEILYQGLTNLPPMQSHGVRKAGRNSFRIGLPG